MSVFPLVSLGGLGVTLLNLSLCGSFLLRRFCRRVGVVFSIFISLHFLWRAAHAIKLAGIIYGCTMAGGRLCLVDMRAGFTIEEDCDG